MLKFADGTKARVTGLDEILADLYSEGRQPDKETADEILDRLEKNEPTPRAEARGFRTC
jgi:hypothetical protein